MKPLAIAAAAVLMTATGALAQEQAREAPPQPEKKICKTEKMTGSLTRVRRVCMTQAQWDRASEGTNRALDRMGRAANQAQAATTETPLAGSGGW